jgi:hypothetical protein
MNDNTPDPMESLRLIDSMINKARNRFSETGHLYLLWGWVILACSLGHYLLQHVVHYPKFYLVWILTWAAVLYQLFYLAKKRKRKTVITYTDEILKYVWLVFIIMMVLLIITINSFSRPDSINPVFLVLYGMPTFLSGKILRFNPLVAGALVCWALAIAAITAIPIQFHMLLISVAVIAAWIIPGYLLNAQYKRQVDV